MTDRAYLLLPVHNRRAVTVRLAEALRAQTRQDFRLVLIDDGSTDGTAAAVGAIVPQTTVITGDGTWWWAGSMAAACRWLETQQVAGDAVIGLMNDDVEIDATFLAAAIGEIEARPDTLILARQIDADTGEPIDAGGGVHVDCERLRFSATTDSAAINCLPSRGLFFRWRDLDRIGGFRPHRLRHYLADYELTLRAHTRGLKLRVSDQFEIKTHRGDTGPTHEMLLAYPRWERLRRYYSHRCKENPRAFLAFAWLTAPTPRKPLLIGRVIARSIAVTLKLSLVGRRMPERMGESPAQ